MFLLLLSYKTYYMSPIIVHICSIYSQSANLVPWKPSIPAAFSVRASSHLSNTLALATVTRPRSTRAFMVAQSAELVQATFITEVKLRCLFIWVLGGVGVYTKGLPLSSLSNYQRFLCDSETERSVFLGFTWRVCVN